MKLPMTLACLVAALALRAPVASAQEGDPNVLALMQQVNAQLASMGLNVAVQEVSFFTIGGGRPADRILHGDTRWVAGDPRRAADGNNITYLVDRSDGATASGLTSAQTEAAIDRALATWQRESCLKKVRLVKRADTGADPDILDFFFGFGGFGTPFLADIVEAGWLPRAFFELIGGPGGGRGIIAFTIGFIFVDPVTGLPTDINGDNYFDFAFAEVYYNDNFGNPAGDLPGLPWGINVGLPGIDVQTVALHENGHALTLGHFGPPPAAVMNPVYAGIRQSPLPTDHAAMCSVWGSWPK
jgi:hypothetical protein